MTRNIKPFTVVVIRHNATHRRLLVVINNIVKMLLHCSLSLEWVSLFLLKMPHTLLFCCNFWCMGAMWVFQGGPCSLTRLSSENFHTALNKRQWNNDPTKSLLISPKKCLLANKTDRWYLLGFIFGKLSTPRYFNSYMDYPVDVKVQRADVLAKWPAWQQTAGNEFLELRLRRKKSAICFFLVTPIDGERQRTRTQGGWLGYF